MLTKKYTKDGAACLVTFALPAAISAERACLVGDFNDWDAEATPMQRQEDGPFAVTIELAAGHEYNSVIWSTTLYGTTTGRLTGTLPTHSAATIRL